MKKFLTILAVAGVMAACNSGSEETTTTDTTVTTVDTTVKATDTTVVTTDSAVKVTVDSTKK